MRVLALARYRFLLTFRSPTMTGVFAGVGAVLVLSAAALVTLFVIIPLPVAERYRSSASGFFYIYVIHAAALVVTTTALGMAQRESDSSPASSLVETAPITHVAAFWGDALGIFAAAATAHLLWFPLICVTFAVTPHPAAALWIAEIVVMAFVLLVSCAGAWSLRSDTWRLAMARLARGMALVILVLGAALAVMTKNLRVLGDAMSGFSINPGPAAWSELVSSMSSPSAVPLVFATVYLGLLSFFSLDAARRAARLE